MKTEIQFDAGERLQASILYQSYMAWAERTGRRVLSLTAFGRAFRSTDIPKRAGRVITYEGIRLAVDNTAIPVTPLNGQNLACKRSQARDKP